jgi:hypothetical protein
MFRGRLILWRTMKAVAVALFCVVTVALSFEVYLRYSGFLQAQPANYPCVMGDSILNHVFQKNCEGLAMAAALKTEKDVVYKTNSFGLRGREPGTSKRRIVVIGDSYTEGFGLSETEAFPFQLEVALKKEGLRDFEVLNGGTLGFSPALYAKYFDRYFSNLRPKLVLLNLDFTDFSDDSQYLRRAEFDSSGKPVGFPGRETFPSWLLPYVYSNRSALMRFVHGEWNQWSSLKLREENFPLMDALVNSTPLYINAEELEPLGLKECWKTLEMTAKQVMELKQRVNSVGAEFAIHMYPVGSFVKSYSHLPRSISFVQAWDAKTRKDFSWECFVNPKHLEVMRAFASRQKIPFFDSVAPVMEHPERGALYFDRDEHWNSRGVEFVTSWLAKPLIRRFSGILSQ